MIDLEDGRRGSRKEEAVRSSYSCGAAVTLGCGGGVVKKCGAESNPKLMLIDKDGVVCVIFTQGRDQALVE
jgi:hypothetical protein